MTSAGAPVLDSKIEDGIALGGLAELLGFHIRMAHLAMFRDFTEALAGLDLTQKQCATLQLIGANPRVSQAEIATALDMDRATMMAIIDRLENRGLVTRVRSAEDRRRQELHLTASGQSALSGAMTAIAAHEAHFKSRFTPAELDALLNALQRIHSQD
ncbi:MAG: MarR family transcriptional regulator [Caulobacterales bacterium]